MKSLSPLSVLLVPVFAVSVLFASGCASGVTRTAGAPAPSVQVSQAQPVTSVSVKMSDAVYERLKNSVKFSQETLRRTVQNHLENNRLFNGELSGKGLTLDILVTHVRVRNTFNAIMWGAMSGNDSVEGEVTVKNAAGEVVDKFKVTASYALGGTGGGQDGTRMGWLYEAFAKETLKTLRGEGATK